MFRRNRTLQDVLGVPFVPLDEFTTHRPLIKVC